MNTFSPQFSRNIFSTINSWEGSMNDIQAMLEWQIIPRNGYKKCRKCKVWKLKTEFYTNKCLPSGLAIYCKICSLKRTKEHQQNNKSLYLKYSRKYDAKNAGVIVEDIDIWYDEQLLKQNGKCALPDCQLPAEKNRNGRLFIDHDHTTGKFRGLLCRKCNLFLGYYEKRKLVIETYLRGG